ncbi:MAG: hypothetical protein IPL49_02985 [Saprospirales bacterium]|nr:hypothetical protein [Saprospirales bacterium]
MQKWALIFLGIVGLACNKNNDTILLDIPFQNLDFTIQAGLNPVDTWYFNMDHVPTNALALFAANGIDTAGVNSITPNTGRLTSVFGDANYKFLYEIAVYLCEEGNQAPKCGKEIFYRFPLPNDPGPFVDVIPNPVELKQLMLQQKVNVQVMLRFISPPPTFIESRLELDFGVK